MNKRQIILVAVDVRSAHNVGSLLRTADAMAVNKVYLIGITPYPVLPDDKRLPHVAIKAERDIHKTALGAEKTLTIIHKDESALDSLAEQLISEGFEICALEQTPKATPLHDYQPVDKMALIVGNEVNGLNEPILNLVNRHLQIPMLGQKESLNVSVAAGIALYHLRFAGRK